jgi:hypothetical protein
MFSAVLKLRGPFCSLERLSSNFGTKVIDQTVKEANKKLTKKTLKLSASVSLDVDTKPKKTAAKTTELNVPGYLPEKNMTAASDHLFIYTNRQKLLVDGFKHFNEVMGHCNIELYFVVPLNDPKWPSNLSSLRLGVILNQMRSRNLYSTIQPALAELGFNVEPRIKYKDVREALINYKELEGHAQVPCDFRVPLGDNRYPEHTRGLHLGFAVHGAQVNGCYEQHHDELKQLGVNFKIIGALHTSFDVIYRAAIAFCELHPGKIIPQNFVVPFGDDKYPEDTWGLELGFATYYLVYRATFYPEHKEKFKKLVASNKSVPKVSFDVIYSALKAYKAIHSDLVVPFTFVVPQGDVRFPAGTWGMKLGRNVDSIRNRGAYPEHRVKLEELGVSFEVENINHYDFLTHIFPALEAYKSVHGNLLVPRDFLVPEGDVRFPADTWRMNLGVVVSTVRNRGDYLKYKERLTALGFVYKSVYDVQFNVIYSALEAYKAVHDNLLVPVKFIVPQGDVRFPAETWGMKLGRNFDHIRNSGAYSEHRVKLEELGFVFKKNKKVVEIE